MLHIQPTKILISKPLKTKKKPQKSPPFEKWKFREKEVVRMSQTEKDETERATGLGRRTKRRY